MARPEAGLLASGSSAAPSRDAVVAPVAAFRLATALARSQWRDRAGFSPDFPWPTGRCRRTLSAADVPANQKSEGRPKGRPSPHLIWALRPQLCGYFLTVHFWLAVPTAT
jgi:hypothetical protein